MISPVTGLAGGVTFDLDGDGVRERVAWTVAGAPVGFLALDRDGDGRIDHLGELFGQTASGRRRPEGTANSFADLGGVRPTGAGRERRRRHQRGRRGVRAAAAVGGRESRRRVPTRGTPHAGAGRDRLDRAEPAADRPAGRLRERLPVPGDRAPRERPPHDRVGRVPGGARGPQRAGIGRGDGRGPGKRVGNHPRRARMGSARAWRVWHSSAWPGGGRGGVCPHRRSRGRRRPGSGSPASRTVVRRAAVAGCRLRAGAAGGGGRRCRCRWLRAGGHRRPGSGRRPSRLPAVRGGSLVPQTAEKKLFTGRNATSKPDRTISTRGNCGRTWGGSWHRTRCPRCPDWSGRKGSTPTRTSGTTRSDSSIRPDSTRARWRISRSSTDWSPTTLLGSAPQDDWDQALYETADYRAVEQAYQTQQRGGTGGAIVRVGDLFDYNRLVLLCQFRS